MSQSFVSHRSVTNPFYMEFVEKGTNQESLKYKERGASAYADARQILVRSCHDILVGYENNGEKGVILVKRRAEPAKGYLWPLGGYIDRGVPMEESLADRVKKESGLDLDVSSIVILGHARAIWKTTPNTLANEKGLPLGTDDTIVLYYGVAHGNLTLDSFHEDPIIVTREKYTDKFRDSLHDYVKFGIDRVMNLI